MKDLLEVIDGGKSNEEIAKEIRITSDGCPVHIVDQIITRSLDDKDQVTKAILTNQIERMKGEKLQPKYPDPIAPHQRQLQGEYVQMTAFNQALQTQIDYLEDVIKKL